MTAWKQAHAQIFQLSPNIAPRKKEKCWGMLLDIPYSKFTVSNYKNLYRGHESFLQSWPDLSDPTVSTYPFNISWSDNIQIPPQ